MSSLLASRDLLIALCIPVRRVRLSYSLKCLFTLSRIVCPLTFVVSCRSVGSSSCVDVLTLILVVELISPCPNVWRILPVFGSPSIRLWSLLRIPGGNS